MSYVGILALILGAVFGWKDFVVSDNPLFWPMAIMMLAAGGCLVASTRMHPGTLRKACIAAYCILAVSSVWASFGTLLLLEPILLLILAASALRGIPGGPLSRSGISGEDWLSTFLYSGFLPFMAAYFMCGHDFMIPVENSGSQLVSYVFNWILLIPGGILGFIAIGWRMLAQKNHRQ